MSTRAIDDPIPPPTSRPLTEEQRARVATAASQFCIADVQFYQNGAVLLRGMVRHTGSIDLTPLNVHCRGYGQAWWVMMALSDHARCIDINRKFFALNGPLQPRPGDLVRFTTEVEGYSLGIVSSEIAADGELVIHPVFGDVKYKTKTSNATVL